MKNIPLRGWKPKKEMEHSGRSTYFREDLTLLVQSVDTVKHTPSIEVGIEFINVVFGRCELRKKPSLVVTRCRKRMNLSFF